MLHILSKKIILEDKYFVFLNIILHSAGYFVGISWANIICEYHCANNIRKTQKTGWRTQKADAGYISTPLYL